MKGKLLKRVFASVLASAMLLTAVPVMADNSEVDSDALLEAEVGSDLTDEEVLLEVKADTLKAADGCAPISISTGLEDYEYWILSPGYSIEQYSNIYLYIECEHGWNTVNITDDMCSYYQSDWINQKLKITVTYKGLQTVLTVLYQYPLSDYSDMSSSDWFYNDANYVYQRLYMQGMDATHWGPYSTLSRAQFATILYRTMEQPEFTTTKFFPDVPAGSWYEDAVLWAAENGIVTGYQNGMFGPADLITRDQMAVMMYRFAQTYGLNTSVKADLDNYIDGAYVPGYAQEAMSWAVGNGIITGKDNGTRLAPLENTARAECAVIISRFEKWAAAA